MQPSSAVTVVDVQMNPTPSGDLIFVSTRLQLNDSTRILTALSEDGGLRAVQSTIPWAVVLPRTLFNRHEAYTPPLTPQIYSNMSLSTQKHYLGYIHRYFQKDAPLAWGFELHVTRAHQRRLYLTQKDPFMFYANGGPVPAFVFTLHLETRAQTRIVTVKVDPNEVLQRKNLVEQRRISLLRRSLSLSMSTWIWTSTDPGVTFMNVEEILPQHNERGVSLSLMRFSMAAPIGASPILFSKSRSSTAQYGTSFSASTRLLLVGEQVPCPTRSGDCSGSPPPQPPPPPLLKIVSAKIVRTTYQKGDPIQLAVTVRNLGKGPAYYVYSRFLIENMMGYYDYTTWTSSLLVSSYLGAGGSVTMQFSVGPLLTSQYALNVGTFLLAKVKIWAVNAPVQEQALSQMFTIEKSTTHKVFAVVYYDRAFNNRYVSWFNHPDLAITAALTETTLYYNPMGSNWQTATFQSLFNTKIIVLRKIYKESFSATDPDTLLENLPTLAQNDLRLAVPWEPNEDKLGTSRYNHGFDVLIAFSGKISSTNVGGIDKGNIFVVFGGVTITSFWKHEYRDVHFRLTIIHEFQHSYDVLMSDVWQNDPNIDINHGHITRDGFLMSGQNGDFYYYYSGYYDLSPTIVDLQRRINIYDEPK